MVEPKSLAYRMVTVINYVLLAVFSAACILPFLYILSSSFTPAHELALNKFRIIPSNPTLEAYKYLFTTDVIPRSIGNSLLVTLVGTAINMVLTVMMAYPLSHTGAELPGRRVIMGMIIFTMLFSGGIIPNYLVVKNLGLIDSYWAVILPGAINAFNLVVLRNFFSQLPSSLKESARLDGAHDLRILWSIILPLSLPSIATFSLFYAVGHWNAFFSPMLYLNSERKWTIQIVLRQMIIVATGSSMGDSSLMSEDFVIPQQSVKMATIIISTVPILIVYPFVQKYFTSGIMVGSIKG